MLFCALAIVILNNNVLLGIGAVYGIFAFLLVLSAFFGLVVLITVLSEVVIENGIVGAIGAFMAMLLATGAIALLGSFLFNLTLSTAPWIVILTFLRW